MTEFTPPRLTLRQRWYRLRTSYRFPFLLFFGMASAGFFWQGYCYWWGVRIHNMVARHGGSAGTRMVYPQWLRNRVGWSTLQPLEPITNLRLVSRSPIPVSDIALLDGLWELEGLGLHGPIEPNGWRHVAWSRNLTCLSTFGSDWCLREADFEQIARLAKLKTMDLIEVAIESRGLRHLVRHPALTKLIFQTVRESGGSIDTGPMELNESSRRSPGAFDVASLRELAAQRTLEELTLLNSPGFGNEHLLALTSTLPDGTKPLPRLSKLRLHKANLTGDGLRHISNLTSLKRLELDYTGLGDDGLRFLRNNSTIQDLNVRGTRIGDRDVETLLTMTALATIKVERTRITEQGLLRLASNPHVQSLYVGADVSMATLDELKTRVDCIVGF